MSRNYKPKFEVIDGLKKCSQCDVEKPISDFHQRKGKHLNGRVVYMSACKKCAHKCTMESNKKNPDYKERRYFWYIKTTYGLLPAQYYAMLSKQNGTCAICKCVPQMCEKTNKLDFEVDHCHATGAVRGLLCGNCNATLGHAKDNIDRLINCAIYLENFNNQKI